MFFCNECGAETPKWAGKCPACGAWDSLRETSRVVGKKNKNNLSQIVGNVIDIQNTKPQKISEIEFNKLERIKSEVEEFDGVLGGGIVPGMVVLIGGEPGIGKSTLLLQIANKLAKIKKILYVSGEESDQQIKLRGQRLKCNAEKLYLYCETDFSRIIETIINFNFYVIF